MNNHELQDIIIDLCERVEVLEKKISKRSKSFTPPTLDEVKDYCMERGNSVNSIDFINHYTANNWYRGKTKIKDWRACVRTWEKSEPVEVASQTSWI